MRKHIPTLLYLIAAALIYPLINSFVTLLHLLGERGARAYLAIYVFLPLVIIVVIVFLINLATELRQLNKASDD